VVRDDDAASSMLAVILMMGFVAAAAVSLFVVGTATLDQTTDDAQERQVENSFRQLNKEVSSVAFGRQKYRTMDFDIEDNRAAFRKANTGQIKVFVDGKEEVDKSVGSLVYEGEGDSLAFQAGGVWRGTGKDSRMVSKPPVEYQDGSLSFPIPVLTGDDNVQRGDLDINKQRTIAPLNDDGYIEGKLVKLEITSEYYMGWAEYFRTQTNDVAVSVDHTPAGPKGTVTVKLGKPVANGDFENGVMATGGDDGDIYIDTNDDVPDELAATGDISNKKGDASGTENVESDLYTLDQAIDRKVQNATNDLDGYYEDIDVGTGTTTLNGGNAYFDDDGFELDSSSDTVNVYLSGGNVTLIVDGDMNLTDEDLNVYDKDTDNALRIYSTGNYAMKGTFAGDEDESSAKHLQIYGTSDMLVAITGGKKTQFLGTIYAPREETVLDDTDSNPAALPGTGSHCEGWDMCVAAGSAGVKGAIVGGSTYMGQSTAVEYDSSLAGIEPTLELNDGVLPPKITFIKVSVHEIAVNNSGSRNLAPAGGFQATASVGSVDGFDGGPTSAITAPQSSASLQVSTGDRRSPVLA